MGSAVRRIGDFRRELLQLRFGIDVVLAAVKGEAVFLLIP
jgi:hypothetical protein